MGILMAYMFVWTMWNIFVGVRIDENNHFGNLARTTPQTLQIHPKTCHASEPMEDEDATAKFMRRFAEFSAGNSQTSGSISKCASHAYCTSPSVLRIGKNMHI
jgi:hypothetical protein